MAYGTSSTGVIWMRTSFATLHLELHAKQTRHPAVAHVYHCVVRMGCDRHLLALKDTLLKLGDTFSRFPCLETIVIETSSRDDFGDTQVVQPLVEALHTAARVDVQHRTSDEAHLSSLQAKKESRSAANSDKLLSPLWCLEEHAWLWNLW